VDQVGAPRDVYEDPETLFVADFLGVSNLMDATARGQRNGACVLGVEGFELQAHGGDTGFVGPAKIVIRPERVELEPHGSPEGLNRVPGMVERRVYVGSAVQVIVRAATGETLQALVQNTGKGIPYERGTPVQLHLPADALRVLPDTTSSQEETA
jgi:spermidine/putrescine transport system ATP-binding protein